MCASLASIGYTFRMGLPLTIATKILCETRVVQKGTAQILEVAGVI